MANQYTPETDTPLNWKTTSIDAEPALGLVNWDALKQYAISVKRRDDGSQTSTCELSSEYNTGGLHAVRRIDFDDGCRWVARLQLHRQTLESRQRLLHEVHTMDLVRERSRIPVPKVFAYETHDHNPVGAAFMLMEFVSGDTAMDSFGGWDVHKGEVPSRFRGKYFAALAELQVEMASLRFPRIGSIQRINGSYEVGPIPGLGGPFDSAADYFEAWAKKAKFPYDEDVIRQRTPKNLAEGVLSSIQDFPSQLGQLTRHLPLQSGPFPLIHTDLYGSNIIIDSDFTILSIIDWENAIVSPWELVEFMKDLSMVPPAMDGPLYRETVETRLRRDDQRKYIALVEKTERVQHRDGKLSAVLRNSAMQNLAQAAWLYLDGRIGLYAKVLEELKPMLN